MILDTEDYANGAAFYYDNKVEIWATNLEFNLRGTTQWLRNVVTHEYAHIVSIQAGMKMPLRIPALYFQAIDFESEKRPDVINGYPDVIVSYPISGTNVPAWWAEGVAQYQSPSLSNDCWDSHRDMILRSGLMEAKLLPYDDMGFLGHRSIDNERAYDHGFGLVRYIASTYGDSAITNINKHLGDWNRLTIGGAIKKVTGKSGDQVYDDWKVALKQRYDGMLVPVYKNPREGAALSDQGFMTLGPTFSPDGKTVAFLSNKGSDYSSTDLYTASRDGKNMKEITGDISSRPFFSHGGTQLIYAKHEKADIYGSRLSDIFVYDLAAKKETRITHKWRASDPSWSPDGAQIVCILNADGTHRLAVMDRTGKNSKVIHAPEKGAQLYSPRFSPDGKRILFGMFNGGTRDIASVAADGSDFRYELRTDSDERDAAFSADGRKIVFASDRTGIFNIYAMDLETRAVEQLTNVVGGAFMPSQAADGALVFAQFKGTGYRVSRVEAGEPPVDTITGEGYAVRATGEFDECVTLKSRPETLASTSLVTENVGSFTVETDSLEAPASTDSTVVASASPDAGMPANGVVAPIAASDAPAGSPAATASTAPGLSALPPAETYDWSYTRLQFYPRVVIWDGVPRLGIFASTNEIMDRQTLFVGGSYGVDGEYDLVINFELRRLFPVLFMQYFKVREKYDDEFPIEELSRYYYIDYRYDVWTGDLGLRFEFEDPYSLTRRNDVAVWWSHSEYRIHLDPEYTPIEDPGAVRTPDVEAGWKYFNGNEAHARWYYKSIKRAMDSDINPRSGREFNLEVMYANDGLSNGQFDYGFNAVLAQNKFGQYTLDYKEYLPMPIPRHTLQLRALGSVIDNTVDDFFWVYMGGMDRLRGYTYYAIGGRKAAMLSATYRFPILRQLNRQASWLTFKDLYGGVFYEVGSAWNEGNLPDDDPALGKNYYSTVGGELRLNMGSFYNYPTAVNFTMAYALDDAVYRNPVFNVPDVVYDPQFRYYLVVGFNF